MHIRIALVQRTLRAQLATFGVKITPEQVCQALRIIARGQAAQITLMLRDDSCIVEPIARVSQCYDVTFRLGDLLMKGTTQLFKWRILDLRAAFIAELSGMKLHTAT